MGDSGPSIPSPAISASRPGTNAKTNRNAYETIRRDTLFTNVALTANRRAVVGRPARASPAIDWLGRPYDPANGPAAHPNSRFTVAARAEPGLQPRPQMTRAACRFRR